MTCLTHVDLGCADGVAALAPPLPNLQSLALRLSNMDTPVRKSMVECTPSAAAPTAFNQDATLLSLIPGSDAQGDCTCKNPRKPGKCPGCQVLPDPPVDVSGHLLLNVQTDFLELERLTGLTRLSLRARRDDPRLQALRLRDNVMVGAMLSILLLVTGHQLASPHAGLSRWYIGLDAMAVSLLGLLLIC